MGTKALGKKTGKENFPEKGAAKKIKVLNYDIRILRILLEMQLAECCKSFSQYQLAEIQQRRKAEVKVPTPVQLMSFKHPYVQ